MTDHNPRELWSDEELDDALDRLNPAPRTDARAMERLRAELMVAAGAATTDEGNTSMGTKKKHWRLVASAAAVVAVAAGVLVAQTFSFNGNPPAASAAAAALNQAADRVGATDQPVGPGQYRYVATRAWWMSSIATSDGGTDFAYLAENLIETWVPQTYDQEWMQRRDVTGKREWVKGTEAEAKAAGYPVDRPSWPEGERRAPCGDFYAADSNEKPCAGWSGWAKPSPEFIAGLPKDAKQLYDRIRTETKGLGQTPDQEFLVYVADFLRSGTVPAETRATVYRALAMVPGIVVTDRAANLDGKVGVAFGVQTDVARHEIIIDEATGQFIGERQTAGSGQSDLPAGTVTSFTSVETAVVDKIGVAPSK
ncbi:hypothetical protein [Alloactinosynnema sp. L-07]|uniref:CU044_5270 family protein n=1 Tax=Alloactinosynnema sp. L-07 TaxID=1653480 RepID=UPI00065EF442|nr:CU044_5270 family protein [Alloactinosynnema sp. L-07]CRK60983.1 hypothetical protein [Alloactinosynnema sp. L-07]